MSADPYIDTGLGSQGLNRYGYVGNKPLSFTDPTGFECGGGPFIDKDGKQAIHICTVIGTPPWWEELWSWSRNLASSLSSIHFGSPTFLDQSGLIRREFIAPAVTQGKDLWDKTKDFLCKKTGKSGAQEVLNTVDNAGTAADAARPAIALGAAAAGAGRMPYSQATSFLGQQLSSGLSTLGKAGTLAGGAGIAIDVINGNYQGALYGGVDYFVYSRLASMGAGILRRPPNLGRRQISILGLCPRIFSYGPRSYRCSAHGGCVRCDCRLRNTTFNVTDDNLTMKSDSLTVIQKMQQGILLAAVAVSADAWATLSRTHSHGPERITAGCANFYHTFYWPRRAARPACNSVYPCVIRNMAESASSTRTTIPIHDPVVPHPAHPDILCIGCTSLVYSAGRSGTH